MTRNRNIGRGSSRQLGKAALLAAIGALAIAGSGSIAAAQTTLYWDALHTAAGTGGGNGASGNNWDTSSLNWYPGTGSADVAWSNTADATATASFGGAAGTVTIGAPITAGTLAFTKTGYTLARSGSNTFTFGSSAPEIDLGVGVTTTTVSTPVSLGTATTFLIQQDSSLAVAADTINFTGTSAFNGTTFNIVGAKVTVSTASFTGSGTFTKNGTGWLSMSGNNPSSGQWIVNAGVLTEGGGSGAFGSTTITVNGDGGANWATAGEMAVSSSATSSTTCSNSITLAGGILGGDNGNSIYSGTITAGTGAGFTTSSIRLGDFWENTSRNLTISGAITGGGNLQIINAGNTASAAATGQILTLSGNNSQFTGNFTIDPDHVVQFNNANAFFTGGQLVATNTSPGGLNVTPAVPSVTGLPIVAMGFMGSAPTINDQTTLGGVFAIGNGLNWTNSLDMSTVAGGKWFLGATTGTTATFSGTLSPDSDNVYRLGGGNGTLLVTSTLTDNGGTGAIIGDSHIGGGGTVVFTQNESYTGMTTINGGNLQLGNGGTTGNVSGAITINSPGVLVYDHSDNLTINNTLAGNGSISNVGTGSITFNAANTLSLTVSGTQVIGANGSFNAPTLTFAGGTLSIAGSAASSTFTNTIVNPGASSITGGFATSSLSLGLGTLTHNSGGTLNLVPLTAGTVTTGASNTSGILGGWFTYNSNDWAANDGSGNVVAYTGYTPDAWATGNNTDVTTSDTPASGATTNSLRFNSITAANTLTLAGTNTVTSGGILETANAGANAVTITGGTIQAGGTNDLVVIQNNTAAPMTIASVIAGSHGLTKSGAGTVILSGTNTYTGSTFINGGTLGFTVDANLGGAASATNQIFLSNGGTLEMAGPGSVTTTRVINFGVGGGVIDVAVSGDGGTNPPGAKFTIGNSSTANELAGIGTITMNGPGILTIGAAQTSYNGAGWIINGGTVLNTNNVAVPLGQVEVGVANGLGAATVPVTINANGELATKVAIANPITLNGGVVGSDGANGSYSSAINVTANSSIRVGNFFSAGGQNPVFSGPISGSGNINIINGQTYDANMAPVPVATGDGHFLTLSGNNSAYTGTITVNAGQGILLSNQNSVPVGNGSMPGLAANATATALPMISLGTATSGDIAPPAVTDNTGAFGGVLAINGGTTPTSPLYGTAINESTLYNGNWFLGSQNGSIYNGSTIIPGNGNLYRLGGGGGALYLYNSNDLSADGNNSVQIGAAAVNGGGTVIYVQQMSYSGATNIVNGTLEMGNNDVPGGGGIGEVDNSMPTGTVLTFGGSNGTSTTNGTLDLQGDNQLLTAAQSLNVAASADPTKQIITSNLNRGGAPATLTIDTTAGSTTWAGVIKDGSGQVALTIQGNTPGNGMTLTGNNTYSGTTNVGDGLVLQVGNGGATGGIASPVSLGNQSKLIFNTSNSFTVKGSISGSNGTVTQNGTGTVTVTNNNPFGGGLKINTGTVASGLVPVGTNTLGTGVVTLNGGKLALQGQQVSSGTLSALQPVSIAASSFNVDALYASSDTGEYPNNSNTAPPTGYQFIDSSGSFYQNGFKVPSQHSNTAPTGTVMNTGGLPGTITAAGDAITSAVKNTVTGTNTPFMLQPLTSMNDIKALHGTTQQINLAAPAVFHNMAILGMSTDANAPATGNFGAGDDQAPLTINFADGSSVTVNFNAFDWFVGGGTDQARLNADALGSFANPVYRFSPISSYSSNLNNVGQDTRAFTMYETDIDMSNINGQDYSNKIVTSMSFTTDPNDPNSTNLMQETSIFAISGQYIPLVNAAAQTYANNVNVTADSGIDVSGSLTATMGTLTIGSNALAITSADTSTNAYSLSFNGTTLSGNPTFNVADSAGGGKGTLVLGSMSGTPASITKSGTGVLQISGASAIPHVLTVNGGVVAVPYTGSSPVGSIASDIAAAYDKGAWDKTNSSGPTITTAAAGKLGTTLGYLDTGSMVDVMYTWYGDLNLDGTVGPSDVTAMSAGNGSSWAQGDLNYDGVKNADDWSLFFLGEAAQDGSIPTGVPEPTTLGLLAAASVMGMRRRRR